MHASIEELERFVDDWADTPEQNKKAFLQLKQYLESKADVGLEFHPREGVTYSLRAAHSRQQKRPLFVMVDVIEDDPRWLSVCFYGDLVDDPDEQGDFVPQGLLGEDAICFDIPAYDEAGIRYVETRIDEAHRKAAEEG